MELRGQLKSWNDQKGFGFIRPEQGSEEIFAHISAMRGARRPTQGDLLAAESSNAVPYRLASKILRFVQKTSRGDGSNLCRWHRTQPLDVACRLFPNLVILVQDQRFSRSDTQGIDFDFSP